MLMIFLIVGSSATYKVDNIFLPEVLLQRLHCIKNNKELLLCLYLRLWMQTIVTHSTVTLWIVLTKVMQQHLSTADRWFCISFCLLQQLTPDILFCNRLSLHKLLQLIEVFLRIEHNTDAFFTITSCSSCFLIIAFKTLWNIIVDDKTYVWFVNTHTEGYRCHNNI